MHLEFDAPSAPDLVEDCEEVHCYMYMTFMNFETEVTNSAGRGQDTAL